MDIKEALAQLDPDNDEHWTADGVPRMDVMINMTGVQTLQRKDVTDAAPEFTRETAREAVKPDPAPDDETEEQAAERRLREAADKPDENDGEAKPDPDPATDGEAKPDPDPDGPNYDDEPAEKNELELLQDQLAVATERMLENQRTAREAKILADEAADEVNGLNRMIEVRIKRDPGYQTAGIRAYIKQQNENRAQRAAGMAKFIETTGLSPKDVASATDPKAPIDKAMGVRRNPPRGTQRPNLPRRQ